MKRQENKKAIVIAAFGSTYPKAISSLIDIQNLVRQSFPHLPVFLSFTSNMVRFCWNKRLGEEKFWQDHPDIPFELAYVKSPLATLADMQSQGYRSIIVQPTYIAAGEEFHDLKATVDHLAGIKTIKDRWRPFEIIALGRPLLGANGPNHPYIRDIEALARQLKPDIDLAYKKQSPLVYLGHGNPYNCNGAYWDFMEVMKDMYPDVPVFIGCVEGQPSFDFVIRRLRHIKAQRALIKPLMIVVGHHAEEDMIGQRSGALRSRLESDGLVVEAILEGLGQNEAVVEKFVQHIHEAAQEHSIDLYEELKLDQPDSIPYLAPKDIEKKAFQKIEAEIPKPIPFSEEQWPVVRRMLHTRADFDLLKRINFHPEAVEQAIKSLQKGCLIHTDTEMARVGINKAMMQRLGCQVLCQVSQAEVIKMAQEEDITQAAAAVRLNCEQLNGQVYVFSNDPSALIDLIKLIEEQRCRPALILAMPAGFVYAAESKDLLQGQEEVPFIVVQGRQGGTDLAVSCINALAETALSA